MAAKKKIRIGVVGLSHDHIWDNLKDLKDVPGGSLVAAADPNQPLLDKFTAEYGCPTYLDAEEMMDQEKLDAVFVYGDNASGVDLGKEAAARGLDLLVEKPMADCLDGADELLATVRRAKVRCMVNWPFAWWPQLQKALAMAKAGEIGAIWQVKYRAAHNGPKEMGCSEFFSDWLYDAELNGAGAFIDYCCYGALLAQYLLGTPSRVSGTALRLCKEDILVEDNGVLVMTYARAIAIAEASWTQIGYFHTYTPVIYGTTGALMVEPRAGGRLWHATEKCPEGKEVKVGKPAAHMKSASAHFVHCLQTGEAFCDLTNDRLARDAQEILEAGLLSAEEGSEVSLPLTDL